MLLSDEEIESITAKALTDNPHWEVDAWGLFSVIAKAQLKKVMEELGDTDLPSVNEFYQNPKDTDSYVYGYNDGQEKTLEAIVQSLLKEIK